MARDLKVARKRKGRMGRLLLVVAIGVLAIGGCFEAADPPSRSSNAPSPPSAGQAGNGETIEVSGALFLDLNTDSPCDSADAPPELAGVRMTFRQPGGDIAGQAVSGPIGHRPLEFGPGKEGWQHPGCRYISLYHVSLPPAESYTVTFEDALPGNDDGVGFTGISDMGEHVIEMDELAANGFAWDFEVQPSYVVGH